MKLYTEVTTVMGEAQHKYPLCSCFSGTSKNLSLWFEGTPVWFRDSYYSSG